MTVFETENLSCRLYGDRWERNCLLMPVSAGHPQEAEEVHALLAPRLPEGFSFAAVTVEDWNRDLSPWESAPVFGNEPFAGGGERTLARLTDALLPALRREGTERFLIGGYSLAGLFALWAVCRSGAFSGAAGVSPSVWFPGWSEFAEKNPPCCPAVYLSLGKREEKTRNRTMASVGDNLRRLTDRYAGIPGLRTLTEWNEGGHFQDPAGRTARGMLWLAEESGHIEK